MASFTLDWQANTTGDHYIGYRTYNDPVNTYTVITVNVVTPGAQQTLINAPGNLYCACVGIEYTGYLIAACEDQTDGNADGIPDAALTWTVDLLEQTDPCKLTTIECANTGVADVTWTTAGSCSGGTGYPAPPHEIPLAFSTAVPGDTIITAEGHILFDLGTGDILSTVITVAGSYKTIPTVTLDGGTGGVCGSSPAFTAVMNSCPSLYIPTYACAGWTNMDVANPLAGNITLPLGGSITLCTDESTLAGLTSDFEDTIPTGNAGDCHCQTCSCIEVDTGGATGGIGMIQYQNCWDGPNANRLISRAINFGETINLGSVIPQTVFLSNGSLVGGTLTATIVACP